MKKYEAIFIINPSLSDKDSDEVLAGISDLMKKNGCNIVNSEKMGKRKLAYKIKKCREGNYYRIDFEAKTSIISELKKLLYLNSNIVRFTIVVKEPVAV